MKLKNILFRPSESRKRGIELMKNPVIGRRMISASLMLNKGKEVLVKLNGKYHKIRELGVTNRKDNK